LQRAVNIEQAPKKGDVKADPDVEAGKAAEVVTADGRIGYPDHNLERNLVCFRTLRDVERYTQDDQQRLAKAESDGRLIKIGRRLASRLACRPPNKRKAGGW
jgi:hypothetical protein